MSDAYDWSHDDKAIMAKMRGDALAEGICPECLLEGEESVELLTGYETVSGHPNDPNGTGWEILYCPECDTEYDRWFVGC